MFYFIIPSASTWIIDNIRQRVPDDVAAQIEGYTYDEVSRRSTLPSGAYCFAGLGVLPDAHRTMALSLWEQLAQAGPAVRLLNHPGKALGRYDLFRRLHALGRNDFQAYQVADLKKHTPHFPVFIRESRHHTGNLTELIPDQQRLEQALANILRKGYFVDDLLVVEYCHTGDEQGIFRKYSAFKVGDAILPRYLSISDYWMVKESPTPTDPTAGAVYNEAFAAEELAYIRDNPHETWLRETFEHAEIDYGRIDYGVCEGKLQAWEINTLPAIGSSPGQRDQPGKAHRRLLRRASKQYFYEQFGRVLNDLASTSSESAIPIQLSDEILKMVAQRRRQSRTLTYTHLVLNMGKKVPRVPWLTPLRKSVGGVLRQIKFKHQRT